MDRKYFDDNIAAYLDGKLSDAERLIFEKELQKNPELAAEAARLKKLDQIARDSQVEMPAEGYFDNLAARIDSKLRQESRPKRMSALLEPLMPKSKVIAILSSVAAIFLIVVIVNQIYQPAAEKYSVPRKAVIIEPKPTQKNKVEQPPQIEVQPAIETHRMAIPDKPAEIAIPDSVLGKVIISNELANPAPHKFAGQPAMTIPLKPTAETTTTAKPDEEQQPARSQAVPNVPVVSGESAGGSTVTSEHPPPAPVATGRGSSKPVEKGSTAEYRAPKQVITPAALSDGAKLAASLGASIPLAVDSIQAIMPDEAVVPGKYVETFNPTIYERRVRALLDSGKYVPIRFTAWDAAEKVSMESGFNAEFGADQTWFDSLSILGTGRWQVENAYREATRSRDRRLANCITARLYIEHYLRTASVSDQRLWESRLESIRQSENAERQRWESQIKR